MVSQFHTSLIKFRVESAISFGCVRFFSVKFKASEHLICAQEWAAAGPASQSVWQGPMFDLFSAITIMKILKSF
jgi:hypothetical protein